MQKLNVRLLLGVFAVLATLLLAQTTTQDLTVMTQHGPVRGCVRHAQDSKRPVYSYFGIQYARSPDYSFRFHYPVDPWGWKEVRNATDENTPFCYQDRQALTFLVEDSLFTATTNPNHPMSENCLTVNVFTPQLPSPSNGGKLLPVIVWIHGGSFQYTASTNKMWMMSAFEDVVLVAVQYRLGVFGFLSFDHEMAPPNSALHDLVKALEWVRVNIRPFGGDPNSVTIFGQSAGSFAASALAISPRSKGLFHRVVAASAVVNIPRLWDEKQNEKAFKITSSLDCNFQDVPPTVTCLRNRVTSSELANAAKENNIIFGNLVDGDFYEGDPRKGALKTDPSIPVLSGVTAGEYDYLLSRKYIPHQFLGPGMNKSMAEFFIQQHLEDYFPEIRNNPDSVQKIYSLYLNATSSWNQLVLGLVDFLADIHLNFPALDFAASVKERGGKLYFYQFSPRPSFYDNKLLGLKRPYNFKRADHCDDLPYFLGFPFLKEFSDRGLTFTKEEKLLSRKMMKVLSNFANTGNPSIDGSRGWPQFPSYMDLNVNWKVRENLHRQRYDAWNAVKLLNAEQA